MNKQIRINESQYQLLQLIKDCKQSISRIWDRNGPVPLWTHNDGYGIKEQSKYFHAESPNEIFRPSHQSAIQEGLIKTYPTETTLNRVAEALQACGSHIQKNDFNLSCWDEDHKIAGVIQLILNFYDVTKEQIDLITHIFETCGYFLSYTNVKERNAKSYIFQYEPKFQTNKNLPQINRYLYHITTLAKGEKILKQGFKPNTADKRQQFSFQYAPRVYFFTEGNVPQMVDYMYNAGKLNIAGEHNTNHMFRIFVIDTKKIPSIKFFYDPDIVQQNAVYTYENVPKDSICHYQDVDGETIYVSNPWNE